MSRYSIAFLTVVFFSTFDCKIIKAQVLFQSVRGIVIDQDSKKPLVGATVSVVELDKIITAISDSGGAFVLRNVPIGRRKIQCSYVGYQTYLTDDIILNTAKEPDIVIELEEVKKTEETILIKSFRNPKLPVNKYALVSGRSFSPEETQRFAASANDPSRMALGFPGVQATKDTRSDIIIRGNNPLGMQWRLEGIDIPNPNHFARKGSSGGGITIFSLSVMDNSDFFTGAMPAEYGNALSGAFDMHFRKGNNQKPEFTFKAGMIGLDFSAEGPFRKGQSSYLVNYRYSTLGLLDKLGIRLVDERESNTFQDLSFNLSISNRKNTSQWNIWGIGGYSKETYDAVEDTLDWKQYDDYAIYDFTTKMGALGIGNTLKLSDRSFLKSSLVMSGQQINYVDDTLDTKRVASTVNDEQYDNSGVSFTTSYNQKFSPAANLKAGIFVSRIYYSFKQDKLNFENGVYGNVINGKGSTWLVQPYIQMSLKPGKQWTINPGVNLMYLGLNQKTTVDPRVSVQYKVNVKQSLSISYGLHSKILPLGSYFYTPDNGINYPNMNLDMMRSHHFILGHDLLMGRNWRLHTELYYQRLYQIPVENSVNSTFWILNELEGYAQEPLVSKGKGKNAGIDISVERFFAKNLFMIASFSYFNSEYEPLNGNSYNTRFNSRTSGSWTGAKEWNWKKNKVFQLGWKLVYNGGLPIMPLSPNPPENSREPVLDETRPYSERVPAYFRSDLRLALRKDKSRISWQLALDVQNVFGRENVDALSRRYDPSVNQWVYKSQSGVVPVLSYQLDF